MARLLHRHKEVAQVFTVGARVAVWRLTLVLLCVLLSTQPLMASSEQTAEHLEPEGALLSRVELQETKGEFDPLTISAMAAVGAAGAVTASLAHQGVQLAFGQRAGIDWLDVGISGVGGAILGPIGSRAVPVVRSSMVAAARWTGRAATVAGTAVLNGAHRAHGALHSVHVSLHNHVSVPIAGAFRVAWSWLTGGR